MKHIYKIFLCLSLVFAIALNITTTANAAEMIDTDIEAKVNDDTPSITDGDLEPEEPEVPLDPSDYSTGSGTLYGHNWISVANRPSGINQYVRLTVYTSVDCDVDIRMKNSSGTVVWSEDKAFRADDDQWRTFWCGSNVCTIEARLSTGNPFVNINVVTAPYLTEYGVPAP